MKDAKITYLFYNPNTEEATADYLLKIFAETNAKKVEAVISDYSTLINMDKQQK